MRAYAHAYMYVQVCMYVCSNLHKALHAGSNILYLRQGSCFPLSNIEFLVWLVFVYIVEALHLQNS